MDSVTYLLSGERNIGFPLLSQVSYTTTMPQSCGHFVLTSVWYYMSMANKPKTASEIGRSGGNTTKNRHGSDHYRRISEIGLKKRWCKHEVPQLVPGENYYICDTCGKKLTDEEAEYKPDTS